MRDLAKSLLADARTHYEIGSVTKQFTAAAILQLKEAGKVDLDASLATYVPSAPHAKDVTIRQLLTHTSGLEDFVGLPNFDTLVGTPVTFDQLMARIADKPLGFTPGTRFDYSSTNFIILGRVVEVVSARSWEDYVRRNLFARAGMTESATIADEGQLADMARGYVYANGQTSPSKPVMESWLSSAGGIVTTALDLQRWSEALASGRVISATDYQLLTTPQHLANGSSIDYGFGMKIDTFEGQPRIWHGGNTLGFEGNNQFFPSQGVRIIALTNAADGGSGEIVAHIYNDLFPTIAAAAAAAEQALAASEDPAVTSRVKAFMVPLAAGHIDRSQMTDAFSSKVSDAMVAGISSQLTALGTPTWVYRGKIDRPGGPVYTYLLNYPAGTLRLVIQFDSARNKVSSLGLTPQQ